VTTGPWLVGGCLLGAAAAVVGWPTAGPRSRLPVTLPGARHRSARVHVPVPTEAGSTRALALLIGSAAAAVAGVAAGPVAALTAGAYGWLATRGALRRRCRLAAARRRAQTLDALGGLAADLRAGVPVSAVLGATAYSSAAHDRITALTVAAARLAEQTGAPLADLLERVEADARAMDRGAAAAEAQAAGARATAWLLAGLPLGGIALGYGIGADPLAVLLGTPIGAGCAVGALMLQIAGLAWADRLTAAQRQPV
jgi:tight adherence protein B